MAQRQVLFYSITSRLLPAFLLVALIPVIMLSTGTFYVVKKVAVSNAGKSVSEQFSLIDAFLEDMVVSTAMELSVIKGHDSFGTYLSSGQRLEIVKADFEGAMVRHPEFLQLRFIDSSGMERLRINRKQSELMWVSDANLQDKSNYYYYQQALKLAPASIYVSDLDLNVEHNKVETPWRLVARIGIKVFHKNKFAGLLLVNVDGNYILSKILPFAGNRPGRAFLLNNKGAYIGYDGKSFIVEEQNKLTGRLDVSEEDIMSAEPEVLTSSYEGYFAVMPVQFYDGLNSNIWRVVLYASDSDIFGTMAETMRVFTVVLMSILGIAAIFSLTVSHQIIRVVKNIVKYIPDAAKKPFEMTGIREFDEIGLEIHSMAVGLKTTTDELEHLDNSLEGRIKEQVEKISMLAKKQLNYEKQLRNIQSQLSQADRLATLGLISATVAHEIGNPLAAIRSSLQVMQGDAQDELDREFIGKIIFQVDKLSGFLRSITKFGGRKEPERKKMDINQLLSEVNEFLKAEMKKHKITFDIENSCYYSLYCDETELRQVIFNIVINSIHELSSSGGTIYARTMVIDGVPCLHLYDSGRGVDDIDQLFNPFYTTKNDGTGLGLAIVRDLIKQNGWDMQAANVDGFGFGIKILFHGTNDD